MSGRFPRLYAAASLKQGVVLTPDRRLVRFPRLYAAASLKHRRLRSRPDDGRRFPRLYAAASLKPRGDGRFHLRPVAFSAALCRGLIEAELAGIVERPQPHVFRGFMPRPH